MTETVDQSPDNNEATDAPEQATLPNGKWEALIAYLESTRGFDFQGYKTASLQRRVRRRMDAVAIGDYAAYQDYLEVHPDEFTALFNTILINVTGFFRDAAAWDVLRTTVIPHILATKRPDEMVRVWSAGCASGEEAYTLAIVFAEALGVEQFRERVKIYATDVDEEALTYARHASYTKREVEGVPPDLLAKYFEPMDAHYVFRKDLRRVVIFGRHDLLQDAPISRVDLLVCRNTLMYFNAEAQARILSRFQFALTEGGYLFLGRAETLMTHHADFAPVDLKRRISMKVSQPGRERPAPLAFDGDDAPPHLPHGLLRDAALENSAAAQLVVDADGTVALANERARALFELTDADVGRLLQDLTLSYRPVELRSLIEQANADRHPLIVRDIDWPSRSGEPRAFDLHIVALVDGANNLLGTSITFVDVTTAKRLRHDLEHTNLDLETAYEELQSTNEELETTNEELQSTVEELETTNEELQSTNNEELETMNEELQSTNEELQTINDELRQRSDELNTANMFLEAILTSLRGGVAVVDRELRVLEWNRHAEDLWGLRAEEARGQHLLNLDIGLPLAELRPALRGCLTGEIDHAEVVLPAVNRRGKSIQCQVSCTPLIGVAQDIRGAILLMEDGASGRPAAPRG
ncbi:MAG TPA: CheR family methyltransferase [Gemmatimonadales bacterium]|nr:CheR family methyltransferase [Gemmatimonadales bacterium]